jgi:hypothetical protein
MNNKESCKYRDDHFQFNKQEGQEIT